MCAFVFHSILTRYSLVVLWTTDRSEYSRGCWHTVAPDTLNSALLTFLAGVVSMVLGAPGFSSKTDTHGAWPNLEV